MRAFSASSDSADELRLQRIDGVDPGLVSLDPPVIGGAEKLAGERADHAKFLFFAVRRCSRDVVHPVAYQLIVTRCSTGPDPGASAK